jgi:hypothetical protein
VVTGCKTQPKLHSLKDPARFPWHEVTKVSHYYFSVEEMKRAVEGRDHS